MTHGSHNAARTDVDSLAKFRLNQAHLKFTMDQNSGEGGLLRQKSKCRNNGSGGVFCSQARGMERGWETTTESYHLKNSCNCIIIMFWQSRRSRKGRAWRCSEGSFMWITQPQSVYSTLTSQIPTSLFWRTQYLIKSQLFNDVHQIGFGEVLFSPVTMSESEKLIAPMLKTFLFPPKSGAWTSRSACRA